MKRQIFFFIFISWWMFCRSPQQDFSQVVVPPQSVLWSEWALETRVRCEAHQRTLSCGNGGEVGISELGLHLHPGSSALTSESRSWKHHSLLVICRVRWVTHVQPVPLHVIPVGTPSPCPTPAVPATESLLSTRGWYLLVVYLGGYKIRFLCLFSTSLCQANAPLRTLNLPLKSPERCWW